jgi:hypothetical protein
MDNGSERSPTKKKKTKRSLGRPFVVTMALGIPATLAMSGTGCGTGSNPAASGGSSGTSGTSGAAVDDGTCATEGAQRPCHLSLGKIGSYQSCFNGTQTCTGGLWSSCGGDGTVTNSLANPQLGTASTGGLHTLGKAPKCGDMVCNGTETCGTCPTDCGACPPGAGSSTAQLCKDDPCNADCLGWGPSTPAGLTPLTVSGGIEVSGFGQIKNGQIQKLALDSCNGSKPCDDYPGWGTKSSYSNCQMDTYCSMASLGGTGCCSQFDTAGTYALESGVGPLDTAGLGSTGNTGLPDLTIGPGCSDVEAAKYRFFPICNRGSAPVPINSVVKVSYVTPVPGGWPGNTCTAGTCAANGYDCSIVLDPLLYDGLTHLVPGIAAPLALGTIDPINGLLPGQCVLLDTQAAGRKGGGGACSQPNGDKWMKVNCDSSIPEGQLIGATGATPVQPVAPATFGALEGCANNWTDHSPDNNPPACTGAKQIAFQVDYKATCPPGYIVVWNKLIYHTATPTDKSGASEIFFEAATAPEPIAPAAFDPATFSDYVTLAEAKWSKFEKNTGTTTVTTDLDACATGKGCCAAADCLSDPENCTFVNPGTAGQYVWFNNSNGPSAAAPLGDGLPASTTKSPSTCPKDIETQFKRPIGQVPFDGLGPTDGAKAARNPRLRLRMTLRPTPLNVLPTLKDWSLSFQCIAQE